MAIKNGVYSGVLKRIGDAQVTNGACTTASVFEIGNHTFQNIRYGNFISTYLNDALESDTPVAIAIFRSTILGIKMNGRVYEPEDADGKAGYGLMSPWFLGLFFPSGCALVVMTFGLGLIPLIMFQQWIKNKANAVIEELEATKV